MTVQTFPDDISGFVSGSDAYSPDYNAVKKSNPRIREVKFGDGYRQSSVVGINPDPKTWTLQWSNITATIADGIEDFLEARAGHEKFYWSPPDDTEVYLWRCRSWQKVMPYGNLFEISATFEEVFEP